MGLTVNMASGWEDQLMYHVIEYVGHKGSVIHETNDLDSARKMAYDHAAHTGLYVEVQNELGKVAERIHVWREEED